MYCLSLSIMKYFKLLNVCTIQNSVRHNLSLNKAFCKLERPDGTSQRKGCLWSLKPEKREQLRREIRKWKKKHPEAIKASMANPGNCRIVFFFFL